MIFYIRVWTRNRLRKVSCTDACEVFRIFHLSPQQNEKIYTDSHALLWSNNFFGEGRHDDNLYTQEQPPHIQYCLHSCVKTISHLQVLGFGLDYKTFGASDFWDVQKSMHKTSP